MPSSIILGRLTVVLKSSMIALKSVEDVPMTKPTLSKPSTQVSFGGSTPPVKLDPK